MNFDRVWISINAPLARLQERLTPFARAPRSTMGKNG
jgi:hypothetical protein